MARKKYRGQVSEEQVQKVLDHLTTTPIKVPVQDQAGEWVFWSPSEQAIQDEARRTVLRESLNCYRNELMSEDERCLLWDRILRLRRLLGIA